MGKDVKNRTTVPQADILFEVSWEVCNKVGGIYTVIKSKAPLMSAHYSNYFLVGPYFEASARFEVDPAPIPFQIEPVFKEVTRKYNIGCHYGIWTVEGSPRVILLDFLSLVPRKDDIKKRLWEQYQIDSLKASWDFEEAMLWAEACGLFFNELQPYIKGQKTIIHCHEWLSGFVLLYLKSQRTRYRTVFTTHATMLGRTIAGVTGNLYEQIESVDPEKASRDYNIEAKHTTEKACAVNADIFTTVSKISGIEAEHFFGKAPDILTPNGLNLRHFPSIQELAIKHVSSRDIIREFLKYYFQPYYKNFDLNENLIYFISCRYEFGNKGIDTFIEALGKLNIALKQKPGERTITAFFWVPMFTRGVRSELRENKDYYFRIKNYVEKNADEILSHIISDFMSLREPTEESIFSREFMSRMRKDVMHFKRPGNPPLLTHYIDNERDDIILRYLKANGLENKEEDRVKVVVYPIYLTGDDPLLGLTYYDAIAGCHLGVFPSIYEPWGYTPLETAAMGVPAVATDLSGFSSLIAEAILPENPGLFIMKCHRKTKEEMVNNLLQIMLDFSSLSHEERVENKINARKTVKLADWEILLENYIQAHNMALQKQ